MSKTKLCDTSGDEADDLKIIAPAADCDVKCLGQLVAVQINNGDAEGLEVTLRTLKELICYTDGGYDYRPLMTQTQRALNKLKRKAVVINGQSMQINMHDGTVNGLTR